MSILLFLFLCDDLENKRETAKNVIWLKEVQKPTSKCYGVGLSFKNNELILENSSPENCSLYCYQNVQHLTKLVSYEHHSSRFKLSRKSLNVTKYAENSIDIKR